MEIAVDIVTNRAVTMLRATLQRTAAVQRAVPTAIMAPVIMWVVDTGIPSPAAVDTVIAPPVSAQKSCCGLRRVIREPIVCNIHHPVNMEAMTFTNAFLATAWIRRGTSVATIIKIDFAAS